MRLSSLSKLLGCVIALGFAFVMATSWYALRELKVNGPLYQKVVQGKDLIADILPPPAYIIEAFLEVNLLFQEPESLDARKSRLKALHKDYLERHAYWQKEDLPEDIRSGFLTRAHEPASKFWRTLEEGYIPAIHARDNEAVRRHLAALKADYAVHRAAIDTVVELANRRNTETEAAAVRLEWLLSLVKQVAGVLGVGLVALCVFGLNVKLVRPLLLMQNAMADLASGNLGIKTPELNRRDEIGDMARSVEVFREAGLQRARMEAEMTRRRQELDAERAAREHEKSESDKKQIETLKSMANQVEETARQSVAVVAEQMDAVVGIVSGLAQKTSVLQENSEGVASAADEALASMQETSKSAGDLTKAIRAAVDKAGHAREATGQAVAASSVIAHRIRSLSDTVGRIEVFTQTINDIARNTNLLALNAGVEAARSGEHGRGFAVIAQEVKALSEQTSQATANIRDLIGAVIEAKDGALAAVGEIGGSITHASTLAGDIGVALQTQAHAVEVISHNVAETQRAAADVAERIARIAAQTQSAGVQTAEADKICSSVASRVMALQRDLIHSLRTSSEYVDRRSEPRVEWRSEIDVRSDRGIRRAIIANISSGGALLEGLDAGVGETVRLVLPNLRLPVTAQIMSSDGGVASVEFESPIDVAHVIYAAKAA